MTLGGLSGMPDLRECITGRRGLGKVAQAPRSIKSSSGDTTLAPDIALITHSFTMSRASKITLATTTLGAIGIVIGVHYAQRAEKAVRLSLHSHGHDAVH